MGIDWKRFSISFAMQWNNLNNTFSIDAILCTSEVGCYPLEKLFSCDRTKFDRILMHHTKYQSPPIPLTKKKRNRGPLQRIRRALNVPLNALIGRILGEAAAFGTLVRDTLRVIQAIGHRAHFIARQLYILVNKVLAVKNRFRCLQL